MQVRNALRHRGSLNTLLFANLVSSEMRFGLLTSVLLLLFIFVGAAPASNDPALAGLSIGDIINALQIGLVSNINAIITVC